MLTSCSFREFLSVTQTGADRSVLLKKLARLKSQLKEKDDENVNLERQLKEKNDENVNQYRGMLLFSLPIHNMNDHTMYVHSSNSILLSLHVELHSPCTGQMQCRQRPRTAAGEGEAAAERRL
mmetsp:Transcript_8724/g.18411  ORF Transcript_8724/g.18411 Transcript_8724/m.18411 type:complete len:123 (+) Transcript_8724:563-931(+)